METQMWRELLIPYHQAVGELVLKFENIAEETRHLGKYSPIEYVTGRVKKISSILDKATKKHIALEDLAEEMIDIAGIRIICQFVEDIDSVVQLIRARKDMDIISERDYVTNTKESGYRSYHIVVYYNVYTALGESKIKAEIQIRTMAMNFWATIEHSLRYKYGHNIPANIKRRLINAAEAAHQLDREMSKIREQIKDAQASFSFNSKLIADILGNIQSIKQIPEYEHEVKEIQDEFYKLWEQNDMEKLMILSSRLDSLAENQQVQRLN